MTTPVLSIIGTVYNQAELAERTLDIWCRQDFDLPYEIIVLDDGSTDGTREMIRGYEERYPGLIRYFYFDEPTNVRNCTLLFNTALRHLMRSEIAVIQWYDRIPGTLKALRLLYEPHLAEDRVCVTFLTRHIGGSSSRDLLEEGELERLLQTVPWREDPRQLERIMGPPGNHCHPHTMNESACFSIKRKHMEEINGYDERYFKVANYSNVELYGRLKNAGIRMHIVNEFTFHQPHPSNREDIQIQIEPDSNIVRNTRIRQRWGQILPDSMVSEDRCDISVVAVNASDLGSLSELRAGDSGAEVLLEKDWNRAMSKAGGRIVLVLTKGHGLSPLDLERLYRRYEETKNLGCLGAYGGTPVLDSKGTLLRPGVGLVGAVTGPFVAFPRRRALCNGLFFEDHIRDPAVRILDFSLQMRIWGGRRALAMEIENVPLATFHPIPESRRSFLNGVLV